MSEELSPIGVYQLLGPSDGGASGNLLDGKGEKDGLIRLQALIAEWLRMENLVVLTGSGTSVSSGGKTMVELEKSVLDTLLGVPDIPTSVSEILNSRIANRIFDGGAVIGFEDWLSYISNAHHIGLSPGSPFSGVQWVSGANPTGKELDWLVDNLRKAIFADCALKLRDNSAQATSAEISPHIAFLSKLVARDSNLGRAHLFTLNYDTLFEQGLELLGIQHFDGFTGRADARFDPSVYGLDIYYPGEVAEGRVRRFDKFLHIYKLHGSIHWEIRDDELRARHPDLDEFIGYQGLAPDEKSAQFKEKLADKLRPAGILPTSNKFAQSLSMPFAHLFRSFQIRLGAPQTFLLVLGYGFGDEHVNRIVETALMNPSLVMLVVEPNPGSPSIERIRAYRELGKRAFVLTQTPQSFKDNGFKFAGFDDFARKVMPNVQWLEDFLRLRRFEKQISTGQDNGVGAESKE